MFPTGHVHLCMGAYGEHSSRLRNFEGFKLVTNLKETKEAKCKSVIMASYLRQKEKINYKTVHESQSLHLRKESSTRREVLQETFDVERLISKKKDNGKSVSIYLSIYLSICAFVRLSASQSIYLYVCVSV